MRSYLLCPIPIRQQLPTAIDTGHLHRSPSGNLPRMSDRLEFDPKLGLAPSMYFVSTRQSCNSIETK